MTQTALEKVEHRSAGQAMAVVDRGHVPAKPQQMTLREIQQWGDVFHQSGMFQDVKSAAAAMVKIKAGEELGFGPFASMAGIDIIKGKVSVGSGLQASLIKDSPRYRYSVKVLDGEGCTLEFFEKLESGWVKLGESSFGKEDAKAAKLLGGDNSMYDKYARNMFFARSLTNGMRWYCPDLLRACGGQSETHDDFDVDETIAETTVTENGETVDTSTGEVVEPESDRLRASILSLCSELNATGLDSIKWANKTLNEYIGEMFDTDLETSNEKQLTTVERDLKERLAAITKVAK